MKAADLAVLGLSVLAVYLIVQARKTPTPAKWADTEAAYAGTWTSRGPLNLATYDGQIYD